MDNTRKMVLLPEDSYKYLASQSLRKDPLKTTQTVGTNLTRKDDEMRQILESDLPPDEKWKEYQQLFNQYLFYKNPFKRKLDVKDSGESDEAENKVEGVSHDKIIDTLPKTLKKTAANFLNFLSTARDKHSDAWNDLGVVTVDDQEIPGSSIFDIVHDVVRKKQNFTVLSTNDFAKLLNDMSVPRSFIGNTALHAALDKIKNRSFNQSGKNLTASNKSTVNDKKQSEKTLRNDSTFDNFQSFLPGTSAASTPKSVKKNKANNSVQNGLGWLSLNI